MSRLSLPLLGPPQIELDGEPVHLPRRKAVALLAYLFVAATRSDGHVHGRDSLATLLWPEKDQRSARAELSRTLSLLNRTLGEGCLVADREMVGTNPDADVWLDIAAFRDRLASCQSHDHPDTEACAECLPLLSEALDLYRDDFLAGFTLRDSAQTMSGSSLRRRLRATNWRGRWCGCPPTTFPRAISKRRWATAAAGWPRPPARARQGGTAPRQGCAARRIRHLWFLSADLWPAVGRPAAGR